MENDKMNKQQWLKKIDLLKKNTEINNNKNITKKKIKNKIIEVIKKSIPKERFGILFSGGVDSSLIALICKKFTNNFTCYSVGFQQGNMNIPDDIIYARKVAKKFNLKLKYKIYNLKELENMVKKTNKIMGKYNNIINVGVGSVEIAAIELAKKKEKYFFSGLGSEEIFAGYERHKKSKDVNEECWNGLKNMYERDLIRDDLISKKYKVKFLTPFLDEEVIKEAMSIPGNLKLNDKNNKLILRKVASELLGKFALRKKKAAQYGSGFLKGIDKLARLNNFKYMKDYLKQQYSTNL